ncbi:methyltransferase [Sulfitobacter sp. LCG007]
MHRLLANPRIQSWAARIPLLREVARRDGAAIFDLLQGFAKTQSLLAVVELRILHRLMDGPMSATDLARSCGVPPESMAILLQAAAGIGLLRRRRSGDFALARKGAVLAGVPGLEEMIRHNRLLYRDLEDPVAFLRRETSPEIASFWPYVFGAGAASDPEIARRFSRLMADSQGLVAADTLATISLKGVRRLLDVGGGTGVFLTEVARRHASVRLALFDLPAVAPAARHRLAAAGLTERATVHEGSFHTDPLPRGADAVSLVRVLYDHEDATVRRLLDKIHEILPAGGRLVISEPMSGGTRPDTATDVYFAFYTRAMGTGRTRSQADIIALCAQAGFTDLKAHAPRRSFVTSVVSARKPG